MLHRCFRSAAVRSALSSGTRFKTVSTRAISQFPSVGTSFSDESSHGPSSDHSSSNEPSMKSAAQIFEEVEEATRKRNELPIEYMHIRAVHLGRKMNIAQLFTRLYTDRIKVQHFLHKNSLVLRLRSNHDYKTGKEPPQRIKDLDLPNDTRERKRSRERYVVYYDYGAVVFFNCDELLTETLMKHAKRFCDDVFEMVGHDEEMMLVSDAKQTKWSILKDNGIRVQEIDQVNVEVIAGVMAQTVALEHYERQVEGILSEFEKLNALMEKQEGTGSVGMNSNKKLFKIIATNNTLLIDLVSKIRVIDRKRPGDAAWNSSRYHSMWEELLEDFELNERFTNLNFKLELIQHNTKFFLEVLGTHKGERLEWYIIFLISAELALSLYTMLTGGGH